MATIIDGGVMVILVDSAVVDCITNATFTSTNDDIETTCKNAEGAKSFRPGANEWSVTADQNLSFDGTGTLAATLLAAHKARSVVAIEFGSQTTGELKITGNVVIPSFTINAGNTGSNVTTNMTFKGDGAYTIVTT